MTLNSQPGTINVNIADGKSHAETLLPCHHPAKQVRAEAVPGRCLHAQVPLRSKGTERKGWCRPVLVTQQWHVKGWLRNSLDFFLTFWYSDDSKFGILLSLKLPLKTCLPPLLYKKLEAWCTNSCMGRVSLPGW